MKRILVLEDDHTYIELLREQLEYLSLEYDEELEIINMQTQAEVETSANPRPANFYDCILLDYYAASGTFHVIDIDHFGPHKVVAISSVESKNDLARQRGVERSVVKIPNRPGTAVAAMIKHVKEIIFEPEQSETTS